MKGKSSPLEAVIYLYPDYPWDPGKFRIALRSQNQLLARVKHLYPGKIVKYNYRHPDMRFSVSNDKMELDLFLPELGFAFEYQGEQHFLSFTHWAGDDGLENIQNRDAEKRAACAARNINLIEVPYWWDRSEAGLKKIIKAGPGPAIRPEQKTGPTGG